jgi:hypothetical protein
MLFYNSLAVQTTLQPWSATIYHSILQYGLQPSITFLELPASLCRNAGGSEFPASADSYGFGGYGGRAAEISASTTYEAVRVHFAAELLMLGFIRKQQLTLNPHESTRLVPGDVLVALSKRADGESLLDSSLNATRVLSALYAKRSRCLATVSVTLAVSCCHKHTFFLDP